MVHAGASAPGLPRAGAGTRDRAAGLGLAACRQCGLPLRRSAAREDEAYCCAGCWIAEHLSGSPGSEGGDRLLARLLLSSFLAMGVMVFSLSLYGERWAESAGAAREGVEALRGLGRLGAGGLSTAVFLLLGLPLLEAVVRMRRWLSTESLVLLGVGAALALSLWNTWTGGGEVYFETASMVLVLVTLGRWLEARAKTRAREELTRLVPGSVDHLAVLESGDEVATDAGLVRVGDVVRVRPGEVLGVDGVVVKGSAFVDASPFTGEATPVPVRPGESVCAGSSLLDGALDVRVTATGKECACRRIDALLEESLGHRGAAVRLGDRLASALVPTVIALATVTFFLRRVSVGDEQALLDAASVVLISCPCALGIATPLAFWVAMGEAWRRGVLVRGAEVLESLAATRRVLLDKTGTLTTQALELERIEVLAPGWDEKSALALAARLEAGSDHPIARAFRRDGAPAPELPEGFRVLPGVGVAGRLDGRNVALVAEPDESEAPGPVVRLEVDALAIARFGLSGRLRSDAAGTIDALRDAGLELEVLTGDSRAAARPIGEVLGVPVRHGLSPADKRALVESAGPGTVFVGDGWNDTGALAAADVGIAVAGGVGRCQERASVNLLGSGLDLVPWTVRLARRATRVARINLGWAFGYNAVGLVLALQGRLTPVVAAGLMVLSSLVVVAHARRAREPRQASSVGAG